MRHVLILALLAAGFAAHPAAAQGIATHADQVAQCVAEEQQRDRVALRRDGQRTRDARVIQDGCDAEVRRAFDDRVLGRTPQQVLPPDPGWTGPAGGQLVIEGAWHHVGIETGADNRYAYFIESTRAQRGQIGTTWLTSVYERTYPDGAASTAYRVEVQCRTRMWRYRYEGVRDAGFRVLRSKPPEPGWRMPVTNLQSPISRAADMLCRGTHPGTTLPAEMPSPGDWARTWFRQNPR